MAEVITDIKIIVKDGIDCIPRCDEDGNLLPMGATVGVKLIRNGRQYGAYTLFDKPTLKPREVADAANLLLESMLKEGQAVFGK